MKRCLTTTNLNLRRMILSSTQEFRPKRLIIASVGIDHATFVHMFCLLNLLFYQCHLVHLITLFKVNMNGVTNPFG